MPSFFAGMEAAVTILLLSDGSPDTTAGDESDVRPTLGQNSDCYPAQKCRIYIDVEYHPSHGILL